MTAVATTAVGAVVEVAAGGSKTVARAQKKNSGRCRRVDIRYTRFPKVRYRTLFRNQTGSAVHPRTGEMYGRYYMPSTPNPDFLKVPAAYLGEQEGRETPKSS